jgi:hypothetical protein
MNDQFWSIVRNLDKLNSFAVYVLLVLVLLLKKVYEQFFFDTEIFVEVVEFCLIV